jgi:hypothetical protein
LPNVDIEASAVPPAVFPDVELEASFVDVEERVDPSL